MSSDSETASNYTWLHDRLKKSHSTSNLVSTFQAMNLGGEDVNHLRSFSEDLLHTEESGGGRWEGMARNGVASSGNEISATGMDKTVHKESCFTGGKQEKESVTNTKVSEKPSKRFMNVEERIRLLKSASSSDLHAPKPVVVKTAPVEPNKWLEARNKSEALKAVQESQSAEVKVQRSKPTRMKVTERAQLFGETKQFLHQRQSLPVDDTKGN